MKVGVVIAAALAVIVIIATVFLPFLIIDRNAILRFIAPTAFETRSIEEIFEGGGP